MAIVDKASVVIGGIAHVLNLFDTVTISDSLVGVLNIWTRLKMDIAKMSIKKMGIDKTPLYRWITRRWTA